MRRRGDDYGTLRLRARSLVAADRRLMDDLMAIRRGRGIDDATMCRRMGVSAERLAGIENGDVDPTLGQIRRYAHAIGATIEHHVTALGNE